MAEKKSAKKPRKRTEITVRERSEQAQAPKKNRSLGKSVRKAGSPFRAIGRFIKKIFRPFRFLLRPFKTKPFRFIGRILSKIFFINYFKGSWAELKLVTWPNRKETRQLTLAVFAFALIFGLFITVVDYGLDKLFKALILK